MEQVLRADRELFTLMAQEHTGPFVSGPEGELPLDLLMWQLSHDPRISMHLLPQELHQAIQSMMEIERPGRGRLSRSTRGKRQSHREKQKQVVLRS